MNRTERAAARARFLEARAAGQPWRVAAATGGLAIQRTAAYLLERRARLEGAAALTDQRQGHPSKLRTEVGTWLEATCRAHPDWPGHQVQQALLAHFDLAVSVSQINRCRARL